MLHLLAAGEPIEQITPDMVIQWLQWLQKQYPFVGTLVIIMILDVITGVLAGWVSKTVSSTTAYQGMIRKVVILLGVGFAAALEPYANSVPLTMLTSMAFIAVEGLSVVENMGRAGVPIPEPIMDALEKIRSGPKVKPPSTVVNVQKADNVDIHPPQSDSWVLDEQGNRVKASDSVIIHPSKKE